MVVCSPPGHSSFFACDPSALLQNAVATWCFPLLLGMAKFTIPSGHCAGSFDGVVISTDIEPDDAIALLALAPRLRGVPLLVIVGQGPVDKCEMASEMLAGFGLDSCATVVQGQKSTASWPATVTACYHDNARTPQHAATIVPGEGADLVSSQLDAFLTKHEAPFALLLKPPHELLRTKPELLRRTVGAIYGSFNLAELRSGMREADPALSEGACHERQEELMRALKAVLWIERSLSVGRDGVIDTDAAPGAWPPIETHPGLMQHVLQWNADTLTAFGKKLASMGNEVGEALSGSGGGGEGSGGAGELGAKQYGEVEGIVEKADKKVQVMLSIARCQGRQVCHADTLVVACLMDDDGKLTRFTKRCTPGHDAKFKPTFVPEASSSVAALMAEAGDERAELFKASTDIVVQGLTASKAGK